MGQADHKNKHAQDIPAVSEPPTVNPDKQQRLRREIGGPRGPEPTRYGDWERNGRCSDF
jgi:hypothetical protein